MKWHSVKERLPENRPIKGKRLVPDFNWVPVTNGKGVWAMARYSLKVVRGKTTPSWEFWPGHDIHETSCPKWGDWKTGFLAADQITHWLDIWLDLPKVEDDDNLLISNADQEFLCKKVHKALYNQFTVNQGYTYLHDPDYESLKDIGKTYDKAAVKAVVDTLIYLGYKIEKNLACGRKEMDQDEHDKEEDERVLTEEEREILLSQMIPASIKKPLGKRLRKIKKKVDSDE